MSKNAKRTGRWIVIAVAVGLVCCSEALAKKPDKPGGGGGGDKPEQFRAVLPLPPGVTATRSSVFGLNESGDLLGWYEGAQGQLHYFFHNTAEDNYVVFDPGLYVADLSDNGAIVGRVSTSDTTWLGLYWSSPQAEPIPLPPLPGQTSASAHRVNDGGVVVGMSAAGTLESRRAVVWKVDAASGTVLGPIELPYFPTHTWANPNALTEEDADGVTLIVGESGDRRLNVYAAVTWEVVDAGGLLVLISGPNDLGSLPGGEMYSYAEDVNEVGVIVGRSGDQAFLKAAGGEMQALKLIAEQANAYGINDSGTIVGWQWRWGGKDTAVVWTSPSEVYDLNRLAKLGRPGRLWTANGINNANMIVASGGSGDESFGVLLIPNQ